MRDVFDTWKAYKSDNHAFKYHSTPHREAFRKSKLEMEGTQASALELSSKHRFINQFKWTIPYVVNDASLKSQVARIECLSTTSIFAKGDESQELQWQQQLHQQ